MLEKTSEENISLKDIFSQYLFHWKLIIVSIIISLFIVTIYLRYISPTYKITASLIVKDDNKGGVTDQLSAFEGLGFNLGGAASKVENEIELLKSRYLISKTVKVLNLNHSYFDLNTTKKIEVYLNRPLNITYLKGDSACYNRKGVIDIQRINESTFELEHNGDKKVYPFGKSISTSFGEIIITPTKYQKNKLFHIRVKLTKFDKTVDDDIMKNPELVATKYPLASAAFFFDSNKLWSICDKGSDDSTVIAVTKRVNGGTIGLDHRLKEFKKIYSLLS